MPGNGIDVRLLQASSVDFFRLRVHTSSIISSYSNSLLRWDVEVSGCYIVIEFSNAQRGQVKQVFFGKGGRLVQFWTNGWFRSGEQQYSNNSIMVQYCCMIQVLIVQVSGSSGCYICTSSTKIITHSSHTNEVTLMIR